jgi:decaprenylphospho-beta-D-erythro-pentofuranosid-2-ulose 2-reductase
MKNGVGVAQNIVLFGGTSEIGQAIIHKLVKPGVSHVVLVSRDIDAAELQVTEMAERYPDLEVHHVRFNADDSASMVHVVAEVAQQVGDIDVAVITQGVLQEGVDYYANPGSLQTVADVNFTGTMVLMYALAAQMRTQGYGKMVLLSSVAGERVRKGNPVYGATKAGIDGFALALDRTCRLWCFSSGSATWIRDYKDDQGYGQGTFLYRCINSCNSSGEGDLIIPNSYLGPRLTAVHVLDFEEHANSRVASSSVVIL